jgi:hypothetical protein
MTDIIYKVGLIFMSKPKDAAQSEVYLASSPEVEGVSGEYFSNKCKKDKPNNKYYSAENEQKLWDYCVKITKPYLN